MRHLVLPFLVAFSASATLHAQPAAAAPGDTGQPVDFETVVVRGVQPGPGLWKVSKGDHVLWILGTLSPLPKDISWNAHRVESLVGGSQEVLAYPDVALTTKAGFFALVGLLPSLWGVRDNPDGKALADVVPPDAYARWVPLKRQYLGRSGKVEHWRPIFAALALYDAAIRKAGMTDHLLEQDTVTKAAKRAHVKITTPRVTITIDDPKIAVREFKAAALGDTACFRGTVDRIDRDLATMARRANAWATGDLEALRQLPLPNQRAACYEAISETRLAHERGGDGISGRLEEAWAAEATRALRDNRSTFALLPIGRLLHPDGYLDRLRAQGYEVEEPVSVARTDAAATTVRGESAGN